MAKRNVIITMVLAMVFMLLLVVATAKFTTWLVILPIYTYYGTIMFIEIDGYYFMKETKEKYHLFGMLADLCLLGIQIVVYYFFWHIQTLGMVKLIIGTVFGLICIVACIKFLKLKNKYCPYHISQDWE